MGAEGAGLSRSAELEQGVAAGKSLGSLRKKSPVSQAASAAPASTSTGTGSSSSSSSSGSGWSVPLPDFSSFAIPGRSTGEKALLVLGVLVLGLMLYGRVTGQSLSLSLPIPGKIPPIANPNSVGSPNAVNTIAQRQLAANPSKSA